MEQATQVALMRRIYDFLDRRTTELAPASYENDVSTYICPDQLARERRRLFRREPLLVGLSRDATEPGAYFSHTETGVPILVVRSGDGTLRAFLGLCRHRGAPLVSGSGTGTGRFTCPYHGWTYDEDGQLVAQPCAEGFSDVSQRSLCLTPLPSSEKYGLVFVVPSPGDPIDADEPLGGAQHELAALGLESHRPFGRRVLPVAMNWKLVIDTFLEAYHVPSLHSRSLAPAILGTAAAWDAFGRSSRLVAVRRSIVEARGKPESTWNLLDHSVVLYHLFPNTMLIHQIDHVEMVQAYPSPSDPDATTVVFTLYTPTPVTGDAAARHFQKNFDLLLEVSRNEDFRLGERIQSGFHVDGHAPLIYGRNEPGLAHFHRMIEESLDDGAADVEGSSR